MNNLAYLDEFCRRIGPFTISGLTLLILYLGVLNVNMTSSQVEILSRISAVHSMHDLSDSVFVEVDTRQPSFQGRKAL